MLPDPSMICASVVILGRLVTRNSLQWQEGGNNLVGTEGDADVTCAAGAAYEAEAAAGAEARND